MTRVTQTRHTGQQAENQAEKTGPRQGLGIQIQVNRESGHRPAGTNLTCRTSPDLKSNTGVQSVKDNLSRSNVAFARNGFAERAQNGQRVGVRSPVGAPDNWGVRDILAEKSGQVGSIVLKFGLDPGLSAVNTSLGGVRGANGDIQGSVSIAQSRGEDVSGPQVRARNETGNLHFRGVIALLCSCMKKG